MRPAGTWLFGEAFFSSTNGEKIWSSELWFSASGAIVGAIDAVQGATDFNAFFCSATLLGTLGTDVVSKGSRVVISDGAMHVGAAFYADNPGTGSSSALPADQCAIVRLQGSGLGPSYRGRVRIAGIDESTVKGSHLTSLGLVPFTTWCGDLGAGFASQGVTWTPNIYRRTANSLALANNIFPVGLLGTQRHRRPRF